jgi:hypothetical protein
MAVDIKAVVNQVASDNISAESLLSSKKFKSKSNVFVKMEVR